MQSSQYIFAFMADFRVQRERLRTGTSAELGVRIAENLSKCWEDIFRVGRKIRFRLHLQSEPEDVPWLSLW